MTDPRTVTCPQCGFQVEDRGVLEWPVLAGDATRYHDRCERLDEAPSPPTQIFYCITLRTAAKRAAMAADIEASRAPDV